jgi:hypothetical protein
VFAATGAQSLRVEVLVLSLDWTITGHGLWRGSIVRDIGYWGAGSEDAVRSQMSVNRVKPKSPAK